MAVSAVIKAFILAMTLLALAPSQSSAQPAQCAGFAGLPNGTTNCYVDPNTDTELEAGVVAVGNCTSVTLVATATYTGIDSLVTIASSPEQGVGPNQPSTQAEAFIYFDFPAYYHDIHDNSLLTLEINAVVDAQTFLLAHGSSTIHDVTTILYTATTDSLITTTATTTSQTSTTPTVATVTVTPTTTLTETASATGPISTVTLPQHTTTTIITDTPPVSTRTVTVHSATTITITCIGSSSSSPSPTVKPRQLRQRPRGQPVGAPELLDCTGPPITTTIVTAVSVTTSTVTVTDTDIFYVASTSTSTVTAPTPAVYVSGMASRATVTPTTATVTKTKTARASTTTVTTTKVRTVTKLPSGKKTPKCSTAPPSPGNFHHERLG